MPPSFRAFLPPPLHLLNSPRRPSATIPRMCSSSAAPIPTHLAAHRVLVLGVAAIDLLATVPSFPRPDEKLRTTSLSVLGGGNAANAATALRRLGLPVRLVSKLANDLHGAAALRELRHDDVDTRFVLRTELGNTTFTYVIIDAERNTRTCISTPAAEELHPDDITDDILHQVRLVVLDCRHTLAAIRIAELAREKRIPILIDIERDRPHVRRLLPYADFIVTNSTYPSAFSPEARSTDHALQLLLYHTQAKFLISTRGEHGSTLITPSGQSSFDDPSPAKQQLSITFSTFTDPHTSRLYQLMHCPAWPVDRVVDTTGAGDAFVAGIGYAIVTDMPLQRALCLASFIAAQKLLAIGSRAALPTRSQIPDYLIASTP